MTSFSTDTVRTLIKLREELADTLKCNYCDKILVAARTLNCSHHVCLECAKKQSSSCKHCGCSYFSKDITNNVCVNNIVETFHNLASNIEYAANIMKVKTNGKYKSYSNESESSSCSEEEEEEEEEEQINNNKKRKRSLDNELSPEAKKQKLSEEEEEEEEEEEDYNVPKQICITGYDKETTLKFSKYALSLGMELNKKWSIGSTDILISKSNITNCKPNITFKVLASILCNIPVVKESFLENSYEKNKILDYRKFICNYRRVGYQGLFENYSILFATTNMPTERLRTLLTLGKANILETRKEIDNKDKLLKNYRIMICAHETEPHQAKQLSEEYNCRVISESWIIKCIYPDDDNLNHLNNNICLTKKQYKPIINFYKQQPIMKSTDLDEFDQTMRSWDDEESSDSSESDSD